MEATFPTKHLSNNKLPIKCTCNDYRQSNIIQVCPLRVGAAGTLDNGQVIMKCKGSYSKNMETQQKPKPEKWSVRIKEYTHLNPNRLKSTTWGKTNFPILSGTYLAKMKYEVVSADHTCIKSKAFFFGLPKTTV